MNIYEAISVIQEYCESQHTDCRACVFYSQEEGCLAMVLAPEEWEIDPSRNN